MRSYHLEYCDEKIGAVALDDKNRQGDSLFFIKNRVDFGLFWESLKLRVL